MLSAAIQHISQFLEEDRDLLLWSDSACTIDAYGVWLGGVGEVWLWRSVVCGSGGVWCVAMVVCGHTMRRVKAAARDTNSS